jgi:hypothetical protein
VPEPTQAPVVQCVSPANGAVGVLLSLTELKFKLTDYQGDLMNYTVTTSPNIGSDSSANKGNGTYTVSVSGLQYSTTYTWHVNVTDGAHWTNETFHFTARNPPEYWWDNRWLYRKPITIDHTMVAANLTDFPVLINVTDTNLAAKAQSDGDDIAFADYYGYKLDHEIEFYNGISGRLIAWVRIPDLSSTTDTIIYIYYGSPLSGEGNYFAVWDSGFLAVHHLSEASGTHYDSTSNNNDGTPFGNLNQGIAGHIDGADDFDGVNDDVELPQVFTSESQFTMEAWFYAEAGSEFNAGYIVSQFAGTPFVGSMFNVYHNTSLQFFINSASTATPVSLGTWYYVGGTFDGTTGRLYINGIMITQFAANLTWPSARMYIGDRADRTRHWSGLIDEVRVSNIPRSANWIRTCYYNQYDPSGFYTVGEEEVGGTPAEAPIVYNPSPADGETSVSVYLLELSFNLTDYQSNLMNYTVTTIPYIGSGSGTNVGNGKYTVPVNYLTYSTTYTWYVNVTDGTNWTSETFQFTTGSRPEYWWDNRWQYRKPIVIDHTKVAANLTNFPVLIDLTDADLAAKVQSDGDDIAFADQSGNKLDHEIEFYSGTSGRLIAWVRIPNLSSTADTTIYMYYGNPDALNQENVEGVWNSNFLAVHHLSETSGTHYDSTANNNDGTPAGGLNQNVTGQIDGADYFDKVDDHVTLPRVFTSETRFTMEAWIYTETGARYFISQWSATPSPGSGVFIQVGSTGTSIEMYINGVSQGGFSISLNTWYHIVATYDGTVCLIYRNGINLVSKASTAPTWPSQGLCIGDRSTFDRQFHGIIDEVRLSNVARSSGWILTCYNNQFNPSSFYTILTEEQAPPTQTAVFVSPGSMDIVVDSDCVVYIEVAYVQDLYAWELQLSYNQTILNVTYVLVVTGGLNEPTQIYHNLTDQTNGRLWWAVSTTSPTTLGISYDRHAILEIHFHTLTAGTSNLDLYGTLLSNSTLNPIVHEVANGSITVRGIMEIDLMVTSINILNHGCSIYRNDTYVDGTAYYYPVEVTVFNNGTAAAGSFYVRLEVYWISGSLSEDSAEILVSGLAPGASIVVNFTSLFHPLNVGYYRLTATVDSRNDVAENKETNNAQVLDNVMVTVIGDINGDGMVNVLDAVTIAQAWDAASSDPQWNILADINHDGHVDILDASRISLHWGEKL